MICSISDDNKEKLFDFLVDHLDNVVDTKAPFSLKGLVASVYKDFGKDVPSDQALSFAHQTPTYLRELITSDPDFLEYLASDIKDIVELQKKFDSATPLVTVSEYIKDVVTIDVKTSINVIKSISNNPGFTTVPQDDEFNNEEVNTNKIKESIAFDAKPRTVNSTTGSEADTKGIPYADRAPRYAFIRHVLNLMFKDNIQDSRDLPLVPGGVMLTAMTAKMLGKDKPSAVSNDLVIVVITDSNGNILRFNNENKVSEDGRVMFYGLRSIMLDSTGKQLRITPELQSVEAAVKKLNLEGNSITAKEYAKTLKDDANFLYEVNRFLRKNPNETVKLVIDGGSMGYIPYDESTITMLSDINFSDNPLNIIIQPDDVGPFFSGAAYFTVPGVSNPILIGRKPMDRALVEKIASTIVDRITDVNTNGEVYELSNSKKRDLVLQYRANTEKVFSIGLDETTDNLAITMLGELTVVTPENKEQVRAKIINFFTTPQRIPVAKPEEGTPVINGDAESFNPSTVRKGSIVKFKIGDNTLYFKYLIPEFTINSPLLKDPTQFNHYSLTQQPDGSYRITDRIGDNNGGMNYMKFITSNAYVKYSKSPGDNKLRQLNAYFTFQVPADQRRKVLPTLEPVEETVTVKSGVEELFEANPELSKIGTVEQYAKYLESEGYVVAYQGRLEEQKDTREFNYYTLNREEALDYGSYLDVLPIKVDDGFLSKRIPGGWTEASGGWTEVFTELYREFQKTTGKTFDILDNRPSGLATQNEFFKFLKDKGYKGYSELIGTDPKQESAYVVTFYPSEAKGVIKGFKEFVKKEAAEEAAKPKSASDKFIDDILKGLYKTTLVKVGEEIATPEQISKAKQWFDKSPLKDKIGFEEMFNIMNSEAVAEFFDGAIRLYHGSDYSDLYHESWHAFSQMFLTVDDKVKLYREVQARSGSFLTNTGKRVAFNEATYEEIEEYLAEDFRNYMLADGKSYNGKTRNSIFRKILNFLKALFGDTTYQQTLINERSVSTVNELFEKLRVGNLTGYSFSAQNQMFGKLNKGIEATKKTDAVQSLSASDSILARQTIDSIFSTLQDTLNIKTGGQFTTNIFRTLRGRMTAYSAALDTLKEKRIEILQKVGSTPKGLSEDNQTILNAYVQTRYQLGTQVSYVDTKGESATGEVTGYLTDAETGKISHIQANGVNVPLSEVTDTKRNTSLKALSDGEFNLEKRKLDTLNWMITNFGDPNDIKSYQEGAKGVIAYHNKKSEYLSYEDRGTEDAADNNTPERFKLAGNETSVFEGGKPEVWYMIRGLHKMRKVQVGTNVVYEPVLNSLGFPELIEFDSVKNRLARILSSSPSVQDMHQRLLAEQKDPRFYYLNQLISKLGDPSNIKADVQEMWGAFYQTFNRTYIGQPIAFIDRVSGKWTTRTGSNQADRSSIKRIWDIYFSMGSTNSPFVTRTSKSRAARLDLKKLRERYPDAKSIDTDRVTFIRDLGIPIDTTDPAIREEIYTNKEFDGFGHWMSTRISLFAYNKTDKVSDIRTFFTKGLINSKKEVKSEGRIYNAIVGVYVEFNDKYSDASLSTPEGDTRYALSLNSSMTAVSKMLNNAQIFSQDDLSGPLAYLSNRNPFAKRSWTLHSMFDRETGVRRKDSAYLMDNVSGLTILENGESVELGVNASSADETAKLMMDIAYFVQRGIIANVTPGEKSTRLSTRVNKYSYTAKTGILSKTGKIWMDIEHFYKSEAGSLPTKIYNSILPYLLGETDRITIMRKADANPQMVENNYDTYKKNGKEFLLFDQILSKDTKNQILELIKDEGFNLEKYLDSNTTESMALKTAISKDFMKYWNNEFTKNQDLYDKGGLITDDILKEVAGSSEVFFKVRNFQTNIESKKEIESSILKALTFNTFIHNMEATIINYGDPAQYSTAVEFHKRISMFSSTGEIFRTDDSMMSILNQMLANGYAKSIDIDFKGSLTGGYFSSVLNSAIMDDPKMTSIYLEQIREGLRKNIKSSWDIYNEDYKKLSEAKQKEKVDAEVNRQVKAYIGMKVADAQGWVTFDSYRLMGKAMNDWSPAQEDLFQKIVRGEDVDIAETIKYFPVMKYQYAGALATTEGLPVMAGHKFSLMPLIPNVIKNSPSLVALHEKMMRSNVDYATMKSGSKITTITHGGKMDLFYKDNDLTKREFDGDKNEDGSYKNPFMPNKVYLEFLKKQQPTSSEFKESSIFATQLRKIIEEGLVEGGAPTDFMPGEKDLTKKRKEWNKLKTDEERLKASPNNYRLYMAYEKAVENVTEKKKQELIKSIGWDKEGSYGKVNTKLLEFLKKEMSRQDISDHEMSYLDIMYNGALKYQDLSVHLSQEIIEKTILSIVNRNLIRQKINGEPLIQVSGLGWENMAAWGKGYNLTKPTQEQLDEFGTNGLTYYQEGKGPNGTTSAMKVKVALQGGFKELLKHKHTDGAPIATIARLNDMINDEAWLNTGNNRKMITMVGVRIPVQGLNSMEFMQVQEFLPEGAGNAIILPAEIVAKSGSDFDIDKLSIYMPNIKTVNDKVELESGDTVGGAENRLLDSMYDILSTPSNYASLVRPNDVYTLSPIANDEVDGIRDYVTEYNPKMGLDGEKLTDISGSDLMQYRYNLYVHVVNKVAQEALGIAAVDNTFNVLFNRVGAYMNSSYRDGTRKQLATKDQGVIKEITLFMPHNTYENENGTKFISLSHTRDAKGVEKISDNISQIINLVLEIAKNDSAFYLQLNKEVIPTLLFLNQAGVPIKQIIYFASHPVIREYMEEIRKARTPVSEALGTAPESNRNFFQAHARKKVMERHGMIASSYSEMESNPAKIYMGKSGNPKSKEAHRNMYDRMISLARNADGTESETAKNAFDEANLLNKIKDFDPKNPDIFLSDEDELVLLHWFHIEDFSKTVRDVKMRLNFDTNRNKSAFMFSNKKALIESFALDNRMPYKIIEDIVETSPISSLYLKDKETDRLFITDLLEPLLPLRTNPKVTSFLNTIIGNYEKKKDIEDRFGDVDHFVNKFFNDFVSYVFQDKLSSFNIREIKNYKNLVADKSVSVEQVPYLKFGAYVKDGVMYIDTKQLIKDFQEGNYLAPGKSKTISGENYLNRGLAPINTSKSQVFSTPGEYFNFVLEREYIRGYIKPDDLLNDTYLESIREKLVQKNPQGKGEDDRDYTHRIYAMAYEEWIRDKALDNIGNSWKLFYSESSYAQQVMNSFENYGLREQYPLLENIVIEERKTKKGNIINLRLLDYDLTGEKVDAYHRIFSDLANPAVQKIDDSGRPLDQSENQRLSELFSRLPVVAFLQSGLNTTGPFSLIRLVPAEKVMDFLSGAVPEYVNKLDIGSLNIFYSRFMAVNEDFTLRSRHKNYVENRMPSSEEKKKLIEAYAIAKKPKTAVIYAMSPFFSMYNAEDININTARETAAAYPNRVFVYDSALSLEGLQPQDSGYFDPAKSGAQNVLGIPTRIKYNQNSDDALSDNTLDDNLVRIEKAIQRIKVEGKTKMLTFSDAGYGQSMVESAPMTFMYLSQRLFEEFNYVNPNYEGQKLVEKPEPIDTEPSNISEVDLTEFLSEKKKKLGKWKKDSEAMNNSQAAIGYPITPTSVYESSSVAYAKALNKKGIKTGIQSFNGVKSVWIFGNLAGKGGITATMLQTHFDTVYKDRIDDAISQGVEIFNIGDAKSGIDVMAAEYLKTLGFRPVKHKEWSSWTKEKEVPIGELTLSPEIIAMVKSGKKTGMSGNISLTPGLYKLSDGSIVRIGAPVTYSSIRDVTKAYGTAENWAKAEGYASFMDLKTNTPSEFLRSFARGSARNMMVYPIAPEVAKPGAREAAVTAANLELKRLTTTQPTVQAAEGAREIYAKLGNKTQSENVEIPGIGDLKDVTYSGKTFWSKVVPEAKAQFGDQLVIAYRGDKQKSFLENYKKGYPGVTIGNPFDWQNETGTREEQGIKSTKRFIHWMVTGDNMGVAEATPEYRQAIIDDIKNGKLKSRPIIYYQEKGYATHATALDYLINKYNWEQPTTQPSVQPRTFKDEEYHQAYIKGGLQAVQDLIKKNKQKKLAAAKQLSKEVDMLTEFEDLNAKPNKTNSDNDRLIELYVMLKNSKELDFEYSLNQLGLSTQPTVQEDSEVIFLENEDDYMEFEGYEQLLSAYENGEIPPSLVQDAYNELSRVNLLKYLYYNPNQLSLKFPSESVQTGQILNPNEVLASKSVVSDKDVMDQIMRCITG